MDKKMATRSNCIVSDEVIATITCAAAREVAGVTDMAVRPNDIKGILSSGAERSVTVSNRESTIALDVYIQIAEGAKIQDVAEKVQQNVKSAVQAMIGKPVTRVNVHIAGLATEENAPQ